jgi:GT2 family glycosyltransferase
VLTTLLPRYSDNHFIENALYPVVSSLQTRHAATTALRGVEPMGRRMTEASVSLIIPLYRQLGFLRHQIHQFALDPDVRRAAELVFVLDSPEQEQEVRTLLSDLSGFYGLPLTLGIMSANGGYAMATNAGAGVATTPRLVLLNSDVVPAAPGWLAALTRRLDEGWGVVGARLLYADNSLQHAGLYFAMEPVSGLWANHHYWKGLPDGWPAAMVAQQVPAVTGACLAIDRAVFDQVGGLSNDYVGGGFEDSDLCLKVMNSGKSIFYEADARLYHFERASITLNASMHSLAAEFYNQWLHHRRWASTITQLMGDGA